MDWKTYDVTAWNRTLLKYFFLRQPDESPVKVSVLSVTANELARAVAACSTTAPADVRTAFVAAMIRAITNSGSLIGDATNYLGFPRQPQSFDEPRFVAHLLFTCLAATEYDNEDADYFGSGFIERLRALTGDRLPDDSLNQLPTLWLNLTNWLASRPADYRGLLLPEPGHLTRIGYTVKLAFPHWRDQERLWGFLDREGLLGDEPPVGPVLAVVKGNRGDFRKSFLEVFDEFRNKYTEGNQRLVEHRFWAAVREASLRGQGQVEPADTAFRVSLICDQRDDLLSVFVMTDREATGPGFKTVALRDPYGDWQYLILPEEAEELIPEGPCIEELARRVLSGKLRLGQISSQIAQGLLPFMVGTNGLLELASRRQFGETTIVLLRKDLETAFLKLFKGRAMPSAYEGWIQVEGSKLRALPSAKLENTSLKETLLLHEAMFPSAIRVAGGVRVDAGWIGALEVLPRVTAPGATSVLLTTRPEVPVPVELKRIKDTDNDWELPAQDFEGDFFVVAKCAEGVEDQQKISFCATPRNENFRPPGEPAAWIAEGTRGTVTLESQSPLRSSSGDESCTMFCERTALLGSDIGVFVTKPEEAAWEITRFGRGLLGIRGQRRGDDAVPMNQAASSNAKRRWRRLLLRDETACGDPEFARARNVVRVMVSAMARNRGQLPEIEIKQAVPDLGPLPLASPSAGVERLVRILAARASNIAGISWSDWRAFALRVLGIEANQLQHVTRAWMEAGLIDIASFARWRRRLVFARKPQLVGFKVGDHVGATLFGLTLPATREDVCRRARAKEGTVLERHLSVSPFVPPSFSLRLATAEVLEEIGREAGLGVCWIDLPSLSEEKARHDGMGARPERYEIETQWSRWSLVGGEHPGVVVRHFSRTGCPDFWLVSRESKQVWSYDLNLARLWASAFLGSPLVKVVDEFFFEANHAYLPLPLARAVGIVGAGLSGPTVNGAYRYPVVTPGLRELVDDILKKTFDTSRLVASEAQQANG